MSQKVKDSPAGKPFFTHLGQFLRLLLRQIHVLGRIAVELKQAAVALGEEMVVNDFRRALS